MSAAKSEDSRSEVLTFTEVYGIVCVDTLDDAGNLPSGTSFLGRKRRPVVNRIVDRQRRISPVERGSSRPLDSIVASPKRHKITRHRSLLAVLVG